MSDPIIPLEGEFAPEEAQGWEGEVFLRACDQAQREAVVYLERVEEALYAQRPAGWVVVGFRERTLVTRFGEVLIRRRLYRDERGEGRFLLDEYLGLKAYQAATPEMQLICTAMGRTMSFREAAGLLEVWLAGLLSSSTCWRLLQRTGKSAAGAEAASAEAVFERGEPIPEAGEREVERLFIEADGLHVRLQREPQSHLELRGAIAYEGWERLSSRREGYRLRGKRVYCEARESASFWEGASLAWARQWDLSRVREVIIGGDGASWIRAGTKEFPRAIWQLDNFHLARACGRAYGAQRGQELHRALRAGKTIEESLLQAPLREGKQAERNSRWVKRVAKEEWGIDWRVRLGLDLEEERGLGCMEGNLAHLLAVRMKGKGRSWSPAGARRMAKVRELLTNDELKRWCYRPPRIKKPKQHHPRRSRPRRVDHSQWLQGAVPALHGPAANAPWVQRLRQRIHPHYLPN